MRHLPISNLISHFSVITCSLLSQKIHHTVEFEMSTFSGDYECSGGLRCGHDNCPPQLELSPWVDCCYQPKWRRCQDSLDLDKGVLSSPFYPNYYEPLQECSWLISVPENFTVTLEFKSLIVSFIVRKHNYGVIDRY